MLNFTDLYTIISNDKFIVPINYILLIATILFILTLLKVPFKNRFNYRIFIILFILVFVAETYTFKFSHYVLIFSIYSLICLSLGKMMMLKFTKNNYEINNINIIFEFILGFYTLGIIYFIVSHKFFINIFTIQFSKISMFIVLFLIILKVIHERKRVFFDLKLFKTSLIENEYILAFMFLSIILSIFIVVNLNVVSTWGWIGDKFIHVKTYAQEFATSKGYPFKELLPWGFQSALLVPNIFFSGDMVDYMIKSYNFFGIIMMFIILVLPYEIAKNLLNLNKKYCYLASFLTVFFGPLGAPFIDPYLGLINIATPIYHNATTFFTVPIMLLISYYLYLYYIKRQIENIVIVIVLLDITFLIKQNGYMLLAPVIGVGIIIYFLKKINVNAFKLSLYLGILLIIPAIYWITYPRVFGITKLETSVIIGSFCDFYFKYFNENFKSLSGLNPFIKIGMIIITSLLGIILATTLGNFKEKKIKKFYYSFLVPLFVISIIIACFLVEDNYRKYNGNFTWQITLIGVCLMPYVAGLVQNIKFKAMRSFVIIVLVAQIFSGMWHLLWATLY